MNQNLSRTVAIVGRPNVGKSAIFNRLVGRRISIVHDQPGVTRDRIAAECRLGEQPYTVVDTGGIGANLDDDFGDAIETEAAIALETADVILFVVDVREGLMPVDEMLATKLHKVRQPVLLVVNKVDSDAQQSHESEFTRLGIQPMLTISAAHGRGFSRLVKVIDEHLPEAVPASDEEEAGPVVKIAMLGRPNVGKSSLVNAILRDERTIVSDVAGTTRDAVDVPFSHQGRDYVFIDTAGLRARSKRDTSVEVFSAMRSEAGIRRADLCALVIDAAAGVTSMDRKIASAILKENKPCIVLLNKFDLYHPDGPKSDRLALLKEHVESDLFFLHYAPTIAVSALKGEHLTRILKAIEEVRRASVEGIGTGVLNRLLHDAIIRNPPPSKKGKRLKMLYATLKTANDAQPIPVADFIMFVNNAKLLGGTYQRYLENKIREACPYRGLPIRFNVRDRVEARQP